MKTISSLIFCLFFSALSISAQNNVGKGIELYKKGSYKEAIEILKKEIKSNPADKNGWFYLALSQLNFGKLKESEKSYKKLVEIDGNNPASHAGLGYLYLMKNDLNEAREEANAALKLDRNNVDAQYVLGVAAFRDGLYDRAYDFAKKIVALNQTHSAGYLLKAESLISSFIKQSGTVMRPVSGRAELLKEADEDLQKYVSLTPNGKNVSFYKEYSESIKFFAGYYTNKDKELPADIDVPAAIYPNSSELKVTAKPRPNYTDQARGAGVSGTITLLINFSELGQVKNVLILKALGFGLDQEAVAAARGIKFLPATRDGAPVSVVKMVQYNFSLY